jgi:ABC-type transport system substrate-binding protein
MKNSLVRRSALSLGLALVTATFLPLPATAAEPHDPKARIGVIGAEGPQHLDPVTGIRACEVALLATVYDTLVRLNPDGTTAPGLAASWSSVDELTFEMKLQPNVKFHDGTPFNAAAVKAHIERGKTAPKSTITGDLAAITSVDVVDDLTLRMKLSAPRAGILPPIFAGRAGMVPSPAAVRAAGDTYGASGGVGAGPFTYQTHIPNKTFSVNAYGGYWQPANRLVAGIDFLGSANEFQIERIRSGEADYAAMKTELLPVVKTAAERGLVDYAVSPGKAYTAIIINWTQPPFDKLKVRQALQHAIDRTLIADSFAPGLGGVAWSPVPSNSWAHDPKMDNFYPYDPARAKALLAEAGHPDGVEFEAGILVNHPLYGKLAVALQDMIAKAGFRMKFNAVEPAQIVNRLYTEKNLPIAVIAYAGADDPGIALERRFSSKGNDNPTGKSVDGLDQLLAAGAATADQEKRASYYRQAERLIVENALETPIYHTSGLTAWRKKVGNVARGYDTCATGNFVNPPMYMKAQ